MSGVTDGAPKFVHSGEPGTTGREPFEDSTATGPPSYLTQTGGEGGVHGTGGLSSGVGSEVVGSGEGHHGHHHHHHHSKENEGNFASGTGSNTGLGVGETATGGNAAGTGGAYAEERRLGDRGGAFDVNSGGFTGTGSGGYSNTGSSGIDSATLGSGAAAGYGGSGVGQEGHSHHHGHHHHQDRVGNEGQNEALYEGSNTGPVTGGAANTDKFDTDKNRGSGVGYDTSNDTTERAQGKGTGGILGVLGTSDKDFTGRDRLGQSGSSAYTDDHAKFSGNTTGPGGSALTGREGNINNNPVAQAKSRAEGTSTTNAEEEPHKKGLMEKIKDATGL
ncbi:hypothetical protein BCR39DRAFT_523119 [Naematelia encephala]|uniref:Uncharacterized protein n=1 Tax=Naematelia encephala TaxID=71784 RepID=A0A1Y2BDJ3_9TREE|nr:hypothetical protein BCR39DRAFT_523119 [Naematelia encephala]